MGAVLITYRRLPKPHHTRSVTTETQDNRPGSDRPFQSDRLSCEASQRNPDLCFEVYESMVLDILQVSGKVKSWQCVPTPPHDSPDAPESGVPRRAKNGRRHSNKRSVSLGLGYAMDRFFMASWSIPECMMRSNVSTAKGSLSCGCGLTMIPLARPTDMLRKTLADAGWVVIWPANVFGRHPSCTVINPLEPSSDRYLGPSRQDWANERRLFGEVALLRRWR